MSRYIGLSLVIAGLLVLLLWPLLGFVMVGLGTLEVIVVSARSQAANRND